MKTICLVLVLLLALPLCAAASEILSDDLSDLEAPLAGLIAAEFAGLYYPADGDVTSEYAAAYLFYMANIFYGDDAQVHPSVQEGFEKYVPLEADEVALLLKWAFGGAFATDDLEGDGRMLIIEDGAYWLGVADGYPVSVTYAGAENPPYTQDAAYPYDYTLTYNDGGEKRGQIMVAVERLDDPETPLCVADFTRVDAGVLGGLAGNWRAADGYWCALMEEGLIFCFNDRQEVVADGVYELVDGALTVTLGGEDAPAQLETDAFVLTLGGLARSYERQP